MTMLTKFSGLRHGISKPTNTHPPSSVLRVRSKNGEKNVMNRNSLIVEDREEEPRLARLFVIDNALEALHQVNAPLNHNLRRYQININSFVTLFPTHSNQRR
jgi:hypothetical protein